MSWQQVYDPFGSMVVSTALAAIPVVVMLVCLGFLHMKAHLAAGLGLLGNSLGGSPRAPQPASPEIAFLPLSIDRQVKGLPQAPMPKQRVAPSGRLTTVV